MNSIVALPIVAATPTTAPTLPDLAADEAKLNKAGRAFDAVKDRDIWAAKEVVRLEAKHADLFAAELKKRNLPRSFKDCATAKEMRAWLATRDRAIPGYLAASSMEMPDAVFYDVARTRTKTIAGLLIKARVAAYACRHYWDEPCEDLDWDAKNTRMLIESLFEAADGGSVEQYLGLKESAQNPDAEGHVNPTGPA